jgi:N-acetylglucosamine kinase-like BadF-type ATPase
VGVIGVDGGNTKTELLAVTTAGDPSAYVRGPGSNAHGIGPDGCVAVVDELVERAAIERPADQGAFFLCGADVPADVEALERAVAGRGWVRSAIVDNDTVALLWAGTDAPDAVAVVCGAGINCVGRASGGRTVRYPALGWETGDWGGSEAVGREVVFQGARAEDGRGQPTALADVVREHFGVPAVAALGEDVHYGRVREQRLGELAPAVVAAADGGDRVAAEILERLADEIVLLVRKALRDLGLEGRAVDVVLGGGMLRPGHGFLHDAVVARLGERAPAARPVVLAEPPVLGAALAALEAVPT